MTPPPRLYHGTSQHHLAGILRHGLVPRGLRTTKGSALSGGNSATGKTPRIALRNTQPHLGNWAHAVTSNARSIYLTDAYPLYFTIAALELKGNQGGLIVEIDTAMLDPDKWRPDEDFLQQVTVGHDALPEDWDVLQRTVYYRDNSHHYEAGPSLLLLGTVAYAGVIPAASITRLALVDTKKIGDLVMWGFDPTITLTNYRFMSGFYQRGTQWLFGADPEPEMGQHGPRHWPSRDGITVCTPAEAAKSLPAVALRLVSNGPDRSAAAQSVRPARSEVAVPLAAVAVNIPKESP